MPEESRTPDLVEMMRRAVEDANRSDFQSVADVHAAEAIWDNSPVGLGIFEGREAIRGWLEDWFGTFVEVKMEPEEILDPSATG